MYETYGAIKHSSTSVILQIMLRRFNAGGNAFNGLTGLAFNTAGLIIAIRHHNVATATAYAQASSNIEDITTLGTYSAPTAGKCRFKEVDATNLPGVYELQFENSVFSQANSREFQINITGATNLMDGSFKVQLVAYDPNDGVRLGLTALPNAAAGANTGLPVVGTQIPNANAAANGGLPTVDANNSVKLRSGTGANEINLNAGAVVTVTNVTNGVIVTTNNDKTNYALSAAALTAIENQIWNAATASHTTGGSFGLKLGALADPWGVSLPGAYGGGTAGFILGTNLNATITSRSSLAAADILAQVNAALDAADAELAALPADSCSLRERIKFTYQYNRFKRTCTNVLETAFKANSSTVLGTDAVSNDGTTWTKNKMT